MKINFNKIHIENFFSFGSADIELNDCGYTLVNGINKNPDDMAKSNGSGKTTIFEAISWALTGETIRGTKDVVNIYGDDGALVELDFSVGKDIYKIIRSKDHSKYKTNLKIFINDEDKSGKGIADSKKLLAEYLPDLTSSLLGSVIILGQGLPQRFTNNSPSGRKEILEKLSKSDFMLQDLKNRLSNRLSTLKVQLRGHEDAILTLNTKIKSYEEQIKNNNLILDNLRSNDVLEASIDLLQADILDCDIKINTYNSDLTELLNAQKEANANYTKKLQESNDEANKVKTKWENKLKEIRSKNDEELYTINAECNVKLTALQNAWHVKEEEYKTQIAILKTEIKNIEKQISEIKAIKDICPTCGQKIPDVHKPDTTQLEIDLAKKNTDLVELINTFNCKETEYKKTYTTIYNEYAGKEEEIKLFYTNEINKNTDLYNKEMQDGNTKFKDALNTLSETIHNLNDSVFKVRDSLSVYSNKKTNYESQLNKLKNELATLEGTKKAALDGIEFAKTETEKLIKDLKSNEAQVLIIGKHIDIINKMTTSITRDFRGYLLINIIEFINKKAKEYALDVFDTDKIEFILNGNNIDIKYDNKFYEALSGGEKQKIDLIVQFSIRDMLCNYLDFSSNILVLDEICDNVDSVGAERLFNLISKKLIDLQSIFIISHHTDFSLPVDRELTVIKGEDKISKVIVA